MQYNAKGTCEDEFYAIRYEVTYLKKEMWNFPSKKGHKYMKINIFWKWY